MNYAAYFWITVALMAVTGLSCFAIGHLGLSAIKTDVENLKKVFTNGTVTTVTPTATGTAVVSTPVQVVAA